MDGNTVRIFDTTLRDGEQAPGNALDPAEKLRLAHQLERLGVDIIEAGFPVASEADFHGVRQIATELRTPVIAALARCQEGDIAAAADSLRQAAHPRIHLFLATSDIHLEHKLRISRDEAVARISSSVADARRMVDDVQFSCEDASRTDPDFLAVAVTAAIAAGATTINLPDTVGYAMPDDYGAMFRRLQEKVSSAREVILSAHCHDDLGMATANSLAAIANGARQVECTINGIGERAGNASLEEIVMCGRVRPRALRFTTGVESREIMRTSQLLSHLTGVTPQPNKAIVGRNAFAHESGIHQHGMLRHSQTYEIMAPDDVGVSRSSLVLGRHSGRAALARRYEELGWSLDQETLERAYQAFVQVASKKRAVHDEDLIALVHQSFRDIPETHRLAMLAVECGTVTARATIRMTGPWEGERALGSSGDGPIAAAFAAIAGIVGTAIEVDDLDLRSVTPGRDAVGHVFLRARIGGRAFTGQGNSTDIVEAAVKALLAALDKAHFADQIEAEEFAGTAMWGV